MFQSVQVTELHFYLQRLESLIIITFQIECLWVLIAANGDTMIWQTRSFPLISRSQFDMPTFSIPDPTDVAKMEYFIMAVDKQN